MLKCKEGLTWIIGQLGFKSKDRYGEIGKELIISIFHF